MGKTFATLKTLLAAYLNRSDLTSYLTDFVVQAQRDLERGVFDIDGEKYTHNFSCMAKRQTFSTDDKYITFPSRIKEIRWLKILDGDTDKWYDLNQEIPSWIMTMYPYPTDNTSRPKVYGLMESQSELILGPTPDESYTYDIGFFAFTADLAEDADTNWWTTNAWEILLFGALIQAQSFIMGDARIPLWEKEFGKAVKKLIIQERESKMSGSYIQVEAYLPSQLIGGEAFDIDVIE